MKAQFTNTPRTLRNCLVAISAPLLVATCAETYRRPDSAASATISFPPPITAIEYFDNGDDCTQPKRIRGVDDPFSRSDRTMVIPADRRIAIGAVAARPGSSSCSVVLAFTPIPGRKYEVNMTAGSQFCSVRVMNITGTTPEPARAENVALSSGGCRAKG